MNRVKCIEEKDFFLPRGVRIVVTDTTPVCEEMELKMGRALKAGTVQMHRDLPVALFLIDLKDSVETIVIKVREAIVKLEPGFQNGIVLGDGPLCGFVVHNRRANGSKPCFVAGRPLSPVFDAALSEKTKGILEQFQPSRFRNSELFWHGKCWSEHALEAEKGG